MRTQLTPRRRLILLIGAAVLFLALLSLDLFSRGLAWRLFWSLTGEESPLAQVRGMVELAGNAIRTPPQTEPLIPIQHTDVNPYGVNTFLQLEVEPSKRERQVQMIAEAGFGWIRQQFPWEDIEIHGRGDFEDRRNVEVVGIIDAWAKYDQIVALAEQYGLNILVRLDNPPAWTHADPAIGTFAPPDDLQDYVNYALAVAERYRGRLRYFQVWNEPNIYPEWGEQAVSPEQYTELLCRTYAALKAVDPQIVVVSAALSPTVALVPTNLNEFIFLQRMYDAGAGGCFDVMSAQGYGFFSGPTDRRLRAVTNNFGRHLYIRDIMVANGDAHKPVWISEAGWNPIDAPEVPPDVSGRANFGVVTREQAAAYMPLAFQRMQEEWSWVGMMSLWFFKRADDSERGQSWAYFRMVEPDFTPLPIYDSLRSYITSSTPTLYQGVHQETDWALRYETVEFVDADGAQFERAARTESAAFNAHGTAVTLRWRGSLDGVGTAADWTETTLHSSLLAQTRAITVSGDFTLDSVIIVDHTRERIAFAAVALALIMPLFLLIVLLRLRR
jgi:hypothetical protein